MSWLEFCLDRALLRRLVTGLFIALCLFAITRAQALAMLSAGAPVLTEVTGDGDAFVEHVPASTSRSEG